MCTTLKNKWRLLNQRVRIDPAQYVWVMATWQKKPEMTVTILSIEPVVHEDVPPAYRAYLTEGERFSCKVTVHTYGAFAFSFFLRTDQPIGVPA